MSLPDACNWQHGSLFRIELLKPGVFVLQDLSMSMVDELVSDMAKAIEYLDSHYCFTEAQVRALHLLTLKPWSPARKNTFSFFFAVFRVFLCSGCALASLALSMQAGGVT